MSKKIAILFLTAAFLFSVAAECFADTAADLKQADVYLQGGYYSQAQPIYASVLQNNPGNDYGLAAQTKLVIISILTGNNTDAKAGIDKLTANYSSNAGFQAALYAIALRYKQVGMYAEANGIYQQIAQKYPNSPQADRVKLASAKEQILEVIEAGKYTDAKTALDSLTTTFAGNSAMPAALYEIARRFKDALRYDDAGSIYQKIVDQYPASSFTAKAQMNVNKVAVWSLIGTSDVNSAQAAVAGFISQYKDNPDLSAAVYGFAIRFEDAKKYDAAVSLFKQIIQQYSDSDEADKAKVDAQKSPILSLIDAGNDDAAMAAISKLTSDFAGNPYLPTAVSRVAEEFYHRPTAASSGPGFSDEAKSNFKKALTIWQVVINNLPQSAITPEACFCAALCYQKLGDYGNAIQFYGKAVNEWPAYKFAPQAQFEIATSYRQWAQAGSISQDAAALGEKQAYENIVQKWPDCSFAKGASIKLGWLNFNSGQWDEAVRYWQLYLDKYSNDENLPNLSNMLYALGRAYEEIGQPDEAILIYGKLLKILPPDDPRIVQVQTRLQNLEQIANE